MRFGEVSGGMGAVTEVSEGMTVDAVMVRGIEEARDWLVTADKVVEFCG